MIKTIYFIFDDLILIFAIILSINDYTVIGILSSYRWRSWVHCPKTSISRQWRSHPNRCPLIVIGTTWKQQNSIIRYNLMAWDLKKKNSITHICQVPVKLFFYGTYRLYNIFTNTGSRIMNEFTKYLKNQRIQTESLENSYWIVKF